MASARQRLYQSLTDAELQEALLLMRLAWLRAHGHGIEQAADESRLQLYLIVTEHFFRGLDPDTGKPASPTGSLTDD